jgi:NitT/TauT family transport system substrate-binding protein
MCVRIPPHRRMTFIVPALLLVCGQTHAQEKLKISYSSVDAPNANWYIAENKGIYQKYGLDVDLVFIPTSTTNVATLVAGSIKVGNISGGSIANAVVGGANLVAVGCFINTLPYELIVHESIRTPQQLKGKSVGISRIGSSSDVAARVLLKGLGLEPEKDVAILQVGGSGERAAAFATGKIVAFPSPPGTIHLTRGMASRTLITTADFPKSYPFPYVCPTTPKSYLSSNRDTVKRLLMALIEATHFFKTRKEESKKVLAKYSRQSNESYLESAYQTIAKLFERVPLATRDGMEVQINEALALARKPGASVKVDDIVDDRLVVDLEKEGFIDRIYK